VAVGSSWRWGWGRGRSFLGTPPTAQHIPARGVFGGTFDPPHLGHLVLAEAARTELGLSEVIFMPANVPPHKERLVTATEHRLAMVRHAVASNSRFVVSTLEVERPGPNYTVDTLRMLRESWGNAVRICFLMGLDQLINFPRWREPQELLQLADFAVLARPGFHADMASLERMLPGLADRVVFVPAPLIGISSTVIRQRVQRGQSIRYLVPRSVERYIYEKGLYL
jgi:nicotinate-nucleotide adenylyltransferase